MALNTRAPSMSLTLAGEETDIDLTTLQGLWSVEQYLRLTDQTNRLIEYSDGVIEVLPMPTTSYQAISKRLFLALLDMVRPLGGDIYYAPLRLQIRPGKFREPDLLLLLDKHDPRLGDEYWVGADLVVEIVSPDKPTRDTDEKRQEYATVGITEYWIVNPLDQTVTVLRLTGDEYSPAGVYRPGERATSTVLPTFSIGVDAVFGDR